MESKKEKYKLLIHTCCAICGISLIESLENIFDITVLFFGSNIHPKNEYEKRKKSVKKLAQIYNLDFIEEKYNPKEWLKYIKGFEKEPEGGKRCEKCFEFILNRTFDMAKNKDFDFFTTTLNASPYKDSDKINKIGHNRTKYISLEKLGIKKEENWKNTKRLAKGNNLYHQKYCGCCFSIN